MAAYAYECENVSLMTDQAFDELSQSIDINIDTDRPDIDVFWETLFEPSTGQWIHHHPELQLIRINFYRLFSHLKIRS